MKLVFWFGLWLLILFGISLNTFNHKQKSLRDYKEYEYKLLDDSILIGNKGGLNFKFTLKLTDDSGYIIKKDAYRALIKAEVCDSTFFHWEYYKDHDTIGKYFKIRSNGNFMVCLYFNDGYQLFEVKPNGSIIKNELYGIAMYGCCIDNIDDAFRKYGDYFYLKTCNTGSGYCAGYFYLFKNLRPQNYENEIHESVFYVMAGFWDDEMISQILSSTMIWDNDGFVMKFILKKGVFDDNDVFVVKKTEKFDMRYMLKNEKWNSPDSAKLYGLFL